MGAEPRELVELAEQLIEDHRAFAEAVQLLEWACEDAPEARWLRRLALCLLKCGRGEDALERARQAIAADDGDPESHDALGLAACDQFLESEAFAAFDRSIELDPTRYEPYFNRAATCFHFGRPAQAAEDFVRSILVEGALLEHRFQYTSMHLELHTADAIVARYPRFRKEARDDGDEALAVLDVVMKYLAHPGKFPKKAPRKLRLRGPLRWTAPALRYIAVWREPARRARGAKLLGLALAASPDDPALRWARVEALRFRKNEPRLRADLQLLSARHRASQEIADAWVGHLLSEGLLELAEKENLGYLDRDPEDWYQRQCRASILEKQGRPLEELQVWNGLVDDHAEDDPGQVEDAEDLSVSRDLYLDRADCLARLGRDREALRDFEQAVRFQEAEFERDQHGMLRIDLARMRRGRFHAEAGRLREALEDMDDCLKSWSDDLHTLEARAQVKERLGDRAGAEADLAEARRLRQERTSPRRKPTGSAADPTPGPPPDEAE